MIFLSLENKESKSQSNQHFKRNVQSPHEVKKSSHLDRSGDQLPLPEEHESRLGDPAIPAVPGVCSSLSEEHRPSTGVAAAAAGLICCEVPTVARDIIYGWARGLVGTFFSDLFAPEEFTHKVPEMVPSIYCSLAIQGFI